VRVLVTGARGQLGRELALVADGRPDVELTGLDRGDLDITDAAAVASAVAGHRPHVVVNAAAFTNVDRCETEPAAAVRANAVAVAHLADACRSAGAHLVQLSTDYVFDGAAARPYAEDARRCPRSVYGLTKAAGELAVGDVGTVVRTGWVCGLQAPNILTTVLRLLDEPGEVRFVDDQIGCPTLGPDLARAVLDVAAARPGGVLHATNRGVTTWWAFVRLVAGMVGHDPDRVVPISTAELGRPAPRPAYSVLANDRLGAFGIDQLPPYEETLARLLAGRSSG
jgi:dTDP-4-dehydrorhamnose reductase